MDSQRIAGYSEEEADHFHQMTLTLTTGALSERRSPWLRTPNPRRKRPFALTRRDSEILRLIFDYRFLQPRHLHALLGGSTQQLRRRCRLLFDYGFLDRPPLQRPSGVLIDELVYAISDGGVRYLAHTGSLPGASVGWYEKNRTVQVLFLDHTCAINEFLICLGLGAAGYSYDLHWGGHHTLPTLRIPTLAGFETCRPDAYFWLEHPQRGRIPYFLELDRAHVSLDRMQTRYDRYFRFWKTGASAAAGLPDFRVLTVTSGHTRMETLRRVAANIGRSDRYPDPWRGFWFTHQGAYDLAKPQTIIDRIFQFPSGEVPTSLLE